MNVVICHTDFRIYWPSRIRSLNMLLQSNGIDLHVIEIAGKGSPYSFAGDADKDNLKWKILFPDSKMEELDTNDIKRNLFQQLDYINPNVIIAGAIAFPSGALCTAWAKKHHKKVIVFDDSKVEDVQRNAIVNFIKSRIYHCVDAMLYPSEDWMSTGRYWGFKENQLFYGIDVVDNEFWQRPILSEQHSNYFLFVGRLIQVKNLLFLLKAYTRYRQEVQNPYDLFIVGDGVERDRICQYIKQTNLEGVKLVPFLQQIDLISIYRNARAFILPSIQETWGLVINEAMASGLPIISSTKCGATSILVKERHNGYTFSPDCEEELIDKMILFDKSSYEEQSLMGEHSLEMISHWGLSKFSEGCYKAIKYVLTAPYRRLSFIDVIILNKWKGRYRPV